MHSRGGGNFSNGFMTACLQGGTPQPRQGSQGHPQRDHAADAEPGQPGGPAPARVHWGQNTWQPATKQVRLAPSVCMLPSVAAHMSSIATAANQQWDRAAYELACLGEILSYNSSFCNSSDRTSPQSPLHLAPRLHKNTVACKLRAGCQAPRASGRQSHDECGGRCQPPSCGGRQIQLCALDRWAHVDS